MKTIYLREKVSGNFEVSNRKDHTHKFTTKKALFEFFEGVYVDSESINKFTGKPLRKRIEQPKTRGLIIKATYSRKQTYYRSVSDFYKSLKQK